MEKKRILILDDEVGFARTLKLGLEDTGAYEVRTEERAGNALSTTREFQPDLILVDVIMPDMDGGDFVAQLEADSEVKHIPIVFVTAVAQKGEVAAQGGKIGGHDFIAKPVGVKGVLEYIERRLGWESVSKRPCEAVTGDVMRKKSILIIDDEVGYARSLKLVLETDGDYECLLATTGVEGLELIKTHKTDLVLLDIRMPGIGGLETLKRIKAIAPDLPVAMVSAVRDEQEATQCLAAGAYDYITKPVRFEYLKQAVLVKLFA